MDTDQSAEGQQPTPQEPEKSTQDLIIGSITCLIVLGLFVWGIVWLVTRDGDEEPTSTQSVPSVPVPPVVEEPVSTPTLTAAEQFELEMLVAMAFVDPATLEQTCAEVDRLGASVAAEQFELIYSPSLTSSNLPYNREGAARAFAAWCS